VILRLGLSAASPVSGKDVNRSKMPYGTLVLPLAIDP
jgi:hypothetical protein